MLCVEATKQCERPRVGGDLRAQMNGWWGDYRGGGVVKTTVDAASL